MIVTLGGFMAVGKSTIGKELANRLGWPFRDLDDLVNAECQKMYNVGISTLIDAGEETIFRAVEHAVVQSRLLMPPVPKVVSLGGGTLHNGQLGEWLEAHTDLFVLSAPWDILKTRIESSQRPLKDRAHELFVERQEGYLRGCMIDVEGSSVEEVVDVLFSQIERMQTQHGAS